MICLKNGFLNSLKKIYVSGFDRKFVDVFIDSQLPIHLGFTTENNFPVEQLKQITKHCSFACLHWTALDVEAIKFFKKITLLFTLTPVKRILFYNI